MKSNMAVKKVCKKHIWSEMEFQDGEKIKFCGKCMKVKSRNCLIKIVGEVSR